MRSLIAYTDGACSGNPGPGGWGVVLQAKSGSEVTKQRELKGGAQETTNNRMELMAAISALEALSRRSIGDHNRHRQCLRQRWRDQMDFWLEEKRLENCSQKAREKRRPVEATRRRSSPTARSHGNGLRATPDTQKTSWLMNWLLGMAPFKI